uniref:Arrestin C-terminal-like domain-containing protein n=1 Tax=Glossina morsitans morsitans TaxID=37546 RepID=A0A1B0G9U6_GLOMM
MIKKKLFQFLDILPVYHVKHSQAISNHHNNGGIGGGNDVGGDNFSRVNLSPAGNSVSEHSSPQTPQMVIANMKSNIVRAERDCEADHRQHQQQQQQLLQPSQTQLQQRRLSPAAQFYRSSCFSFPTETLLLNMTTGELIDTNERSPAGAGAGAGAGAAAITSAAFTAKDELGTQRVYKKTSPNCVLTLYLPSREITLSGNSPAIIEGIVYVDPKAIQGYRVYAQLTLTFRYGREDEEVMGLRFCNEAIMSLHQIWPRNEEPHRETLTPLQDALMKRLGEGAHPFTLSLTSQAPPSVQLVPAKRYYGAPIGTSYDVRCFIADKTDDKFHRRASVKMGVRVIYPNALNLNDRTTRSSGKGRKSERGDSFPKLRLSPKSFRFSSRFGRSKSEVEKCPSDPFYNYSKSFQEYDCITATGGGPQGAVDKPFLLQDGRVGLKASLDKAWYTHGEEICVTINIRNDSRKTVRKIRVNRIVTPGTTFNTAVILKPQRGTTKNWIALEDSLQRSTEPDEITGNIAASAVRTPHYLMQTSHSPNYCSSPGVCIPPAVSAIHGGSNAANGATNNERNVFAIYVSYYVKVKLTLSGMGGELSLKLPFVLVHIDEEQKHLYELPIKKLTLDEVPANRKITPRSNIDDNSNNEEINQEQQQQQQQPLNVDAKRVYSVISHNLDHIESLDSSEQLLIKVPSLTGASNKRRLLMRSETIAKDLEEDLNDTDDAEVEMKKNNGKLEQVVHMAQIHYDTNTSEEHIDKEEKIYKSDETPAGENLDKLSLNTTNKKLKNIFYKQTPTSNCYKRYKKKKKKNDK